MTSRRRRPRVQGGWAELDPAPRPSRGVGARSLASGGVEDQGRGEGRGRGGALEGRGGDDRRRSTGSARNATPRHVAPPSLAGSGPSAVAESLHWDGGAVDLGAGAHVPVPWRAPKLPWPKPEGEQPSAKVLPAPPPPPDVTPAGSIPDRWKGEQCAICLGELGGAPGAGSTEEMGLHALACGHGFHPRCIRSWLEQEDSCPLCKKPVRVHQRARTATEMSAEVGGGGADFTDLGILREGLRDCFEQEVVIVWFRQDLRLHDNPALFHACPGMESNPDEASGNNGRVIPTRVYGRKVIPLFVHAPDDEEGGWPLGGAARLWLHNSLLKLDASLRRVGSRLIIRDGREPVNLCEEHPGQDDEGRDESGHDGQPLEQPTPSSTGTLAQLRSVVREVRACHPGARVAVHFNRVCEPWKVAQSQELVHVLAEQEGCTVRTFKGVVLHEPWEARPDEQQSGLLYGFGSVGWWRRAVADRLIDAPLSSPVDMDPAILRQAAPASWPLSCGVHSLGLARMPRRPLHGPQRTWRAGHHADRAAAGAADAADDAVGPQEAGGPIEHRDWSKGIAAAWGTGEEAALAALQRFARGEAATAFEDRHQRFRADLDLTAQISPYMRFGELSPRRVVAEVMAAALEASEAEEEAWKRQKKKPGQKKPGPKRKKWEPRTFLRRLAWRDLAYWSLWYFPTLADKPLRPQYEEQWWADPGGRADGPLRAWQLGLTGYPLVDAAMRQLWAWGWMPNYLRHVVAGFLVEYLGIDWRHGEAWFHDTLVDADVAINAFMWQNGGHSGMDMWNFVMHPVNAAKSCDPEGHFTRQWVPELASLPVEYLHCPWEAPLTMLAGARVKLVHCADAPSGPGASGRPRRHSALGLAHGCYPHRIVTDLDRARRRMHDAVLAVRRTPLGKSLILPDGNEALRLPGGRVARLITRRDWRDEEDAPVTVQTAAEAWDRRRRAPEATMGRLLYDETTQLEARQGASELAYSAMRTVG